MQNFWKTLKCLFGNCLTFGEELIMGKLEEVEAKLDAVKTNVEAVDVAVEALYEQIKQLTGNGISDAAAERLNTKIAEIEAAVAKVGTDDEPPVV